MEELNGASGVKPLLKKENEKVDSLDLVVRQPLRNSNLCMFILFLSVASVMMSTGMAVGALNPTLAILRVFYNQTYQDRYNETITGDQLNLYIALTVSMLLAGGFVGALLIGVILSWFSRKESMIIMNLTNVLSVATLTLGGSLGPSYEAVIIGRFIMGLFSGFGMNLIPIVVAESCAFKKQSFYLSLIGVNLSLGGLIGLCLGFRQVLGTVELWPILLAMSALPSLVYLALSPWIPESPMYLLRKGKRQRALEMLKVLREFSTEQCLSDELDHIESVQRSAGDLEQVSLAEMFKSVPYRRQLVVVVMVFIQAQLCGINAVGMYTNTIFETAGFDDQTATTYSTIAYVLQFIVACFGSAAVYCFGPKLINLISGSVMAASLVVLTVAMVTAHTLPAMSYLSVVAVAIYILIWACGINLTLFPMLTAFTTDSTREAACLFGGGIFWIFSWFVSFIPTYLLEWFNDYAFLPFAVLNVVFVVYVAFCLPETNGKSPAEIQSFIQSGKVKFEIKTSKV